MKSRKLYVLMKHHIYGKVNFFYNHKSGFTVLTKKESIRSCSRSEVLKFFLEILRVFAKIVEAQG